MIIDFYAETIELDTYFQEILPKFVEQSAEEIPSLLHKTTEYV